MPGGAQAIREPWRSTYAHLVAALGWPTVAERYSDLALYRHLASKPLATIDRMLARGFNVPLASSCGRLFDAVAAALGFCADLAQCEGQGAMQLEAAADGWQSTDAETPYPFSISEDATSEIFRVDPSPMWQALLADLVRQAPVGQMAVRFHRGLAQVIRDTVVRIRGAIDGGSAIETVALSGGCLQNKVLLEELVRLFDADNLRCLLQARVPANDGGLSLGQAAIAAARQIGRSEHLARPSVSWVKPHDTERRKRHG
jgi:hydrogenase maturation protein HypF